MIARPTVGVLALQGDVREHLRALESSGATAVGVRRPAELDAVDGLVIPGGESTTISKLAAAFELLEPLRKRIAGGMPTYGSCAGMILLADRVLDGAEGQETLGGLDVTVRRNAFGRQVDSFEETIFLAGVDGGPFHAVFIRAPWVESVGGGVQVLGEVAGAGGAGRTSAAGGAGGTSAAGGAGGTSAAGGDRAAGGPPAGRIVAVRQESVLATSFHPELAGDARVHALFVRMVKEQS